MALKYIKLLATTVVCGLNLTAFGQSLNPSQVASNPLTVSLSSTLYSSMHSTYDSNYSLDSAWSIAPYYRITDRLTFIGSLNASKALSGERKFEMNSINAGGSFMIFRNSQTQFRLSYDQMLPTAEREKDIQGLKTSSAISAPVSYTFAGTGLTMTYRPGVRFNFHEYEVARDGRSNYRYVLSNSLSLFYVFNDVMSVSGYIGYGRNFSYAGNTKDLIYNGQAINAQVTERFSLSLGHQLDSNPLAPNGSRQNLTLIDNQKSLIYTSLMYQL